jgi:hypothetical protein
MTTKITAKQFNEKDPCLLIAAPYSYNTATYAHSAIFPKLSPSASLSKNTLPLEPPVYGLQYSWTNSEEKYSKMEDELEKLEDDEEDEDDDQDEEDPDDPALNIDADLPAAPIASGGVKKTKPPRTAPKKKRKFKKKTNNLIAKAPTPMRAKHHKARETLLQDLLQAIEALTKQIYENCKQHADLILRYPMALEEKDRPELKEHMPINLPVLPDDPSELRYQPSPGLHRGFMSSRWQKMMYQNLSVFNQLIEEMTRFTINRENRQYNNRQQRRKKYLESQQAAHSGSASPGLDTFTSASASATSVASATSATSASASASASAASATASAINEEEKTAAASSSSPVIPTFLHSPLQSPRLEIKQAIKDNVNVQGMKKRKRMREIQNFILDHEVQDTPWQLEHPLWEQKIYAAFGSCAGVGRAAGSGRVARSSPRKTTIKTPPLLRGGAASPRSLSPLPTTTTTASASSSSSSSFGSLSSIAQGRPKPPVPSWSTTTTTANS